MFEWFGRICLVVMIIIIINSVLGDILFRIQYSSPKVSKVTAEQIYTHNDPVQINLSGKDYFEYKGETKKFVLNPQAEYSISGLVVAKNSNFWFRDIMRSDFDDLALLDLGIVWGNLASDKKELYKHIKFNSKKTLGQARMLYYRWNGDSPWSSGYITSHISHTHMIPANNNVMGGLLKIKKNDIVKIDGYLVDIYTDKSELVAHTSMSRTDNNATSRGSGACEDMYVKKVQIGNKIYE